MFKNEQDIDTEVKIFQNALDFRISELGIVWYLEPKLLP